MEYVFFSFIMDAKREMDSESVKISKSFITDAKPERENEQLSKEFIIRESYTAKRMQRNNNFEVITITIITIILTKTEYIFYKR